MDQDTSFHFSFDMLHPEVKEYTCQNVITLRSSICLKKSRKYFFAKLLII